MAAWYFIYVLSVPRCYGPATTYKTAPSITVFQKTFAWIEECKKSITKPITWKNNKAKSI